MKPQLILTLVTATTVAVLAELTNTLFLPDFNSDVTAQAASNRIRLNLNPRKNAYGRGESVELVVEFKPDVPIQIIQTYQHEQTRQDVREILLETRTNGSGIVRFTYSIPSDDLKDNLRLTISSQAQAQTIRIPLGKSITQSPKPPSPSVNFPIKVSSPKDKIQSGDYMQSDVTLSQAPSGGLIYAKTVIWTKNKFDGFTGGVEVVLLDERENVLYVSQLHKYGVNGKYIPGAPSSRTETWSDAVPTEVMAQAKKIAIVHRHTPKNRLMDFLKDLKQVVEYVKPVIQALS